jgi:hypothetical protein
VPIASGTVTEPEGSLALPGKYEVRLTAHGITLTQSLIVELDPREHISRADLEAQFDLGQKIDAALSAASAAYRGVADVRSQVQALKSRVAENANNAEIARAASDFDNLAEAIAGRQVEWPAAPGGLLELERTFAALAASVGSADSAPTSQARESFDEAQKQLDVLLRKWEALKKTELESLIRRLRDTRLSQITPGGSGQPPRE